MSTESDEHLNPLQQWAAELFHFSHVAAGARAEQTPLGKCVRGADDSLLSSPDLIAQGKRFGVIGRENLLEHLRWTYAAVEGES